MKYKKPFLLITFVLALVTLNNSQAQTDKTQAPRIFNSSDPTDLMEFTRLSLDTTHPDLLDPSVARDDQKNVVASWAQLHKSIGKYLDAHDFTWDIKSESVAIYQRIYFNGDGQITNYLFNIKEPEVTVEKKEEFGKLLASFAAEHKLAYARPTPFAQCGKTRLAN